MGKAKPSFSPKIETRATGTQATPLAGDVLDLLRKQIAGGVQGVTPLQQESGTAIRQFVNSGGGGKFDFGPDFMTSPFGNLDLDFSGVKLPQELTKVRDVASVPSIRDVGASNPNIRDVSALPSIRGVDMGRTDFGSVNTTGTQFRPIDMTGVPIRQVGTSDIQVRDVPSAINPVRDINVDLGPQQFSLEGMLGPLQQLFNRTTEQQVGDLRESMGIAGTRFGTALARGESDLREGLTTQFAAQIASLLPQIDASRRADAELKLRGQEAGIARDVSINNLLTSLLGLGVQRDTSLADLMTNRLGLGVQRDVAEGEQSLNLQDLSLRRDMAVAQDNQAMRELDLRKLLGASQEGLGLQELGVRRDIGAAEAGTGREALGVQRDTAASDALLRALGLGVQRDVAAGDQALTASQQGISRDLGIQGNELQRILESAALQARIAEALGTFGLNRTIADQSDQLARTQTVAGQGNTEAARLLQAITAMSDIGADQFAPILQMALAGIQPDTHIVKDSGLKSGADAIGGLLTGIGSIAGGPLGGLIGKGVGGIFKGLF